jgi:Protein of unknown function (DUF3631)
MKSSAVSLPLCERLLRDIRNIYFTRRADWMFITDLTDDLRCHPHWRDGKVKKGLYPYRLIKYLRDFNVEPERRMGPRGVPLGGYRYEILADLFERFVTEPPKIITVAGEK